MNTHANELKNCLLKIIDEMALSSDIFNLSGKPAFCRKSKFNFSTLIQFILSFGSSSLGHEIGEFFEYRKGVPTVSAFVQQRKKLSYTALEHLFCRFNECTFKNLSFIKIIVYLQLMEVIFHYLTTLKKIMLWGIIIFRPSI